MCISNSAVSHQIKSLEDFLGTKLFIRRAKGLDITPAGQHYLEGVTGSLDRIEAETAKFIEQSNTRAIVVNVYQSMAQLWLLPILQDFLDAHPDISLRLVTSPDEVDLTGAEVDIAIRFFPEQADIPDATFLFDETVCPVASPEYLEHHPIIREPLDLTSHRLIECTWFEAEWDNWLAAMGVTTSTPDHRFMCDTRAQALMAAARGYGIALDRFPHSEEMTREGKLVPLREFTVSTNASYYLLVHQRASVLPYCKMFCKWLEQKCQDLRTSHPTVLLS